MENLILTQVHYDPLEQKDFKKILTYYVERTANDYINSIKSIDYEIFALKQVRLKLNKDGSIPHNLNRAFYIEGATFNEKESKEHSFNSYFATTENGKHYNFTTRIERWCGMEYIKITVSPCDAQGYTHCDCYTINLPLRENLTGQDDLKAKCDKLIEKLKSYQEYYIARLNNINKVAKDLESVDLRGIDLSTITKRF